MLPRWPPWYPQPSELPAPKQSKHTGFQRSCPGRLAGPPKTTEEFREGRWRGEVRGTVAMEYPDGTAASAQLSVVVLKNEGTKLQTLYHHTPKRLRFGWS